MRASLALLAAALLLRGAWARPTDLQQAALGVEGAQRGGDARRTAVGGYTPAAEQDRVQELPGWGKTEFGLFSGCVRACAGQGAPPAHLRPRRHGRHRHGGCAAGLACPRLRCPCRLALVRSYVTVDEEAGRALFYAFVESSGSPGTDPLVLWLNGWAGGGRGGGGGVCAHAQLRLRPPGGVRILRPARRPAAGPAAPPWAAAS